MTFKRALLASVSAFGLVAISVATPVAARSRAPEATLLASFGARGSGSTIGPDGALYVTAPAEGTVLRIDRRTGDVTEYASGLPPILADVGLGGAMDVAFLGTHGLRAGHPRRWRHAGAHTMTPSASTASTAMAASP